MTRKTTDVHNALVLQGGGALGAYEAGTYQEIFKHALRKNPDGPVFDIVAGTSIGAINSSVLVGHYLRNGNSWEGSAEKLLEFWDGLSTPKFADAAIGHNPAVSSWWDYLHSANPNIADAESARRFWSIFEFSFTTMGVPKMYRPVPEWGSKFLNPFADFLPWWRYDYTPLRKYLSEFVDFPIKTSFEKGQPRLLLTSVDVQDYTTAIVFDSYEKLHPAFDGNQLPGKDESSRESGRWYSEYGATDNRHVVHYDGIGPDQVLASALGKYSLNHPRIYDVVSGTDRELWDGGYVSNTPLREMLVAHRKFWLEHGKINKGNEGSSALVKLPELEVYIVNLHPSYAKDIPVDKDLIDNRENDILFHDRTLIDEMMAYLRNDYVTLALKLVDLARSRGLSKEVEEILKIEAKSIARTGGQFRFATYRDIIDGKGNLSKVWRIDRRDSSTATFGKTTDFTRSSLRTLISEGITDAKVSINRMKILFAVESLIADGLASAQDGEEMMRRGRVLLTTGELFNLSNDEIKTISSRFLKRVSDLVRDPKRRLEFTEPFEEIMRLLAESARAPESTKRDAEVDKIIHSMTS